MQQSNDGRFEAEAIMIEPSTQRVRITSHGAPLTWRQVRELWRSDEAFGRYYSTLLASSPFASFFWECPPITQNTLGEAFEHVTVAAHTFREASPEAFAHQLVGVQRSVISFDNLNGDATLVVPREDARRGVYGHLGAFLRGAPAAQQAQLWFEVGAALERVMEQAGERPVWLSTAGKGVPWLHVRLDAKPKYYRTEQYKRWAPTGRGRSRRRRRFLRAMEEAARAGRTEDTSAEGNWPADGEQGGDRSGAGELRRT